MANLEAVERTHEVVRFEPGVWHEATIVAIEDKLMPGWKEWYSRQRFVLEVDRPGQEQPATAYMYIRMHDCDFDSERELQDQIKLAVALLPGQWRRFLRHRSRPVDQTDWTDEEVLSRALNKPRWEVCWFSMREEADDLFVGRRVRVKFSDCGNAIGQQIIDDIEAIVK